MAYRHYANPKKRRDWTQQFGNIASGLGNLAQIIQGFQQMQAAKQAQALEQQKFDVGQVNQNNMRSAFKESAMPGTSPLNQSTPPARNNLRELILQSKQRPPIPRGTGPINPRMDINAFDPAPIKDLQNTARLAGQPLPDMLSNVKVQQNQPIPMQSQININPDLMARAQTQQFKPGTTRNIPGWTDAEIEAISQNPNVLPQLLQAKKEERDPNQTRENYYVGEVKAGRMTEEQMNAALARETKSQNQTRENYLVDEVKAGRMTRQQMNEELARESNKTKEVNLEPIVDTFLTRKFGSAYTSSSVEGKKQYIDYLATPEGRADFEAEAPKLAAMTAKPFYQVVPTNEGLVQFNTRKPSEPPVKTGLGKPLPASELNKGSDLSVLMNMIESTESLYNPGYVGPYEGRKGEIEENWINIPEDQATFYATNRDLVKTWQQVKSGLQMPEEEAKRIEKFLPDPKSPDSVYKARLKRFKAEVQLKIEERQKELEGGGYGKSKSTEKSFVPQTRLREFHDFAVEKGYNRQQAFDWIEENKERLRDEGLDPNLLKDYIGESLK